MTVSNFEDHPFCRAAEFIGQTLGEIAGRYDRLRGQTYRAPLDRIVDRTRHQVRSEPHPPTDRGIGALGEIARIEVS
jgi:hypothetical protein